MHASPSKDKEPFDWSRYFIQYKISKWEVEYRAEQEDKEIRLAILFNISPQELIRVIGICSITTLERMYRKAARGELIYKDGTLQEVVVKEFTAAEMKQAFNKLKEIQ